MHLWNKCYSFSKNGWYQPEVSMDRIRMAIFSDQDWSWIFIFEKIGSGQDQDIGLISITNFSSE